MKCESLQNQKSEILCSVGKLDEFFKGTLFEK